jgi:hypothetical protein
VSSVNRDLFISHSSGDAEVARTLRAELEDAGYTCWLAPDDVVGTSPWAEQILAAIAGSRAMLVLVSERSNRSQHVSREVGLANGRNRAIIPVRIEHVPIAGSLEYHLEGLQRIDAFPPPITDHVPRILRRLSMIVPLDASSSGASSDAVTTVSPVFATPLIAPQVSTETEVVRVPAAAPVATAPVAAAPAASTGASRPARPRWVPAGTGLSAALVTLVALIALGTGVLAMAPLGGSPSGSPSGTQSVVGSAGASPAPATVLPSLPPTQPSPSIEPDPSVSSPSPTPSATGAKATDPGPRPTRTPRPATNPPAPTKTPKPPTPPPTQAPTPTPTPATKPARITSHAGGSTIHGPTVTFTWSAATGAKSVRFYGVYVGSTPPGDPCTAGYCKEPDDDAFAAKDIDAALGLDPGTTSAQLGNLPMDGSTIYVRLFTKYNPDTGLYTWRDYTFTSAT